MVIISFLVIISILLIWIQFYRFFFWKKQLNIGYKILFLCFIIAVNAGSLLLLNWRYFKSAPPLIEFSEIDINLTLKYASLLLKESENKTFSTSIKKDLLQVIKLKLNSHKIARDPESDHNIELKIEDLYARTVYQDKYLIQLILKYVYMGHHFSTSTAVVINQPKNLTQEHYLKTLNTGLERLFNTLHLMDRLKKSTPDEILGIMEHDQHLTSSDYSLLFNFLSGMKQPFSDQILFKMAQTEDGPLIHKVLGYAIEHNRCTIMPELLNYIFYEAPRPRLYRLMPALSQSQCRTVEGFFWVLSHSSNNYLAEEALKHLQQFYSNRLDTIQINYHQGKRVD